MTDRPLPWFGPGQDPGSSFSELLRRAIPEVRLESRFGTGAGTGGAANQVPPPGVEVPHGTTVVALRYADGVMMAGDRRATSGMQISGRRMEKVQRADEYAGVALAGAAGPAMELVRLFQTELEHYEKVEGEALSLDGKANRLSQMVRANLPAALQGLVVVPLFAGYDTQRSRGRLFQYDVTGGRYEELDYHATGSGSQHARNWIKAKWREGMTKDEAIDLGIEALFNAADEDAATGGPDVIRGIYPQVATIDPEGFVLLEGGDVAERTHVLLERLAGDSGGGDGK